MIEIDIKSKAYPGTTIKVSDIDHDAVVAHRWYVSMNKDGRKRIVATITNDFDTRKTVQLTHFIRRRDICGEIQGQIMQVDGDSLNFTRENIVPLR